MGTTTLQIQLDEEALREATTQAVLGALPQETRDELIKRAIHDILRPSTSTWDRGKSAIELAFEQAVNGVAKEAARKMVAEDHKLQAKLTELLRVTADKMLNTDVDKLADKMADALVSSMKER